MSGKVKPGFKIAVVLLIAAAAFIGFYKYAESQPDVKNESVQVIDSVKKETVQPVANTNASTTVTNPVAVNTIAVTNTVEETPVVAKASNNSTVKKKDKVAKVQEPTKKKKKSEDRENLNVNY